MGVYTEELCQRDFMHSSYKLPSVYTIDWIHIPIFVYYSIIVSNFKKHTSKGLSLITLKDLLPFLVNNVLLKFIPT